MPLFRRGSVRLAPEQAHTRNSDGTAVLLDVRETPEWRAGHAPGAVHLPLPRLWAEAALPDTVQGRPVVANCRSGHRSRQAAEPPAARGADAVDGTGGRNAWAGARPPVLEERGQDGRTA